MRRSLPLVLLLLCLPSCSDALDRLRARKDAGAPSAETDPRATEPGPAPPATTTSPTSRTVPTTPPRRPAPVATDAASLEKSFAAFDINPDGNLDGIELQRCGCISADRDGNGEVSKAEYMAAGLLGKLPPPPAGPNPKPGPAPGFFASRWARPVAASRRRTGLIFRHNAV